MRFQARIEPYLEHGLPASVTFKDVKFVPVMFVSLGFESQNPLLRAIFHGLGTQTQGYKPSGYKGNSLKTWIVLLGGTSTTLVSELHMDNAHPKNTHL